MSEDFSSQNMDFIKEFAHEGLEVLTELADTMVVLVNQSEQHRPVSARTYESIARHLGGIHSSSRFLGIDSVRQVAEILVTYLNRLPGDEYAFAERECNLLQQGIAGVRLLLQRLVMEDMAACLAREADGLRANLSELAGEQAPAYQTAPEPAPKIVEIPPEFRIEITPEMLAVFLAEADEHLEQAESSLLGLEKSLQDADLLNTAFRSMHTFKGNSGLFGFDQMERLGHEFESILEHYRSGEAAVTTNGISLLLRVLDLLKAAVHRLPESRGHVAGFAQAYEELIAFQATGSSAGAAAGAVAPMRGPIGEDTAELLLVDEAGDPGRLKRAASTNHLRVDLFKLDTLMNLIGELVIAENAVCHNPDLIGHDFQNFKKAALQLNRISRELQDISLSLRMVPIEGTFHRMVRVVRDISHKQGKEIELVMEGEETEIDKTVVEGLAGPLLHLIRNAIDHGIEAPATRVQLGKPRKGIVKLRAYHDGGEVVIEIRDDGRGMDHEKILAKARERGLIAPGVEPASRQEILDLVFLPGFSTAEQLTELSGRGVGMDVVKRNIEAIKGRVHLFSTLGQGSLVSIRIPLTLAIIEGMLIRVGQQQYTVPMVTIRESLRTTADQICRTIDGSEIVRIRNRLIPILRLHRLFDVPEACTELTQGILVIVEQEQRQFCLFADEILGQYQTVIKGLSGFLGGVRGVSGTSIMSNGDISLILDLQSLVRLSGARTDESMLAD